ncbi:MAG: 8-oxo-dGTP diphosphatase [Clostridia bacterium]|nr:8-oxo-dGTP diphosphatase [Clostridia bacterium]
MFNTTLCYIEKDDKYLMLHRVKKKNDMNHDKWIGIGGKLEDEESPFDGARREILEETGLTVNELSYRGIITFVSDEFGTEYMHLFHTTEFQGKLREDCDEGNLEWIEKQRLLSLPIWEGDKIFLSLLDQNVPFFSLKLCYKGDTLVSHTLEYAKNV